ncbi:MAG: hypothetical protein ACFE92_15590 [Promethearchaeota archaeon]
MKKGPVCYIYYAIKQHRQSKLEEKNGVPENEKVPSQIKMHDLN